MRSSGRSCNVRFMRIFSHKSWLTLFQILRTTSVVTSSPHFDSDYGARGEATVISASNMDFL